ncbi:ATP-binding protein [Methanobrevibacter filiformis]|uniref:Putative AAA-ATPase n=1 Tax=Methanobrevibacter filiformis TaxID=55758 RepID=A0A165ZFZ6_9EURY|nr:ATP-binding protein [Methanobrevibacter filiformis]KZX10661.1 putative AAA-ATPase [Methanobrevibacter filiformis]
MKNNLQKLPLGISSFEDIRTNSYLYVDKTKDIFNIVSSGKIYFLSRPRRFGKSLLINTLKNLFLSNKYLFKGLYVYDKWNWGESYPVIHLDISDLSSETNELLKLTLADTINNIAREYNISLNEHLPVDYNFSVLIREIYKTTNKKVVVLIDEYDVPILDNIGDEKIVNDIRKTLQSFYNALKSSDDYIRFIFITGISKFAHTSIFSKLNNPTDITLSKEYSTICGISHNELEEYLHDYIENLANKKEMTYSECLDEINRWYDGYSWDGENRVFNPYSTLSSLSKTNEEFSDFWFGTGTPNFLVKMLKSEKININYFKPINITKSELEQYNPLSVKITPVLFQSGYLTIKKKYTDKNNRIYYTLGIPNFEVETGFKDNLIDLYEEKVENMFKKSQELIWDDIINSNCEKLSKKLRIFIAEIPYYLRLSKDNKEKWKFYSMVFSTWARVMDFEIIEEKTIEDGRIDFVLNNIEKEQVIIVEMKYTEDQNKTLDTLIKEAFKQINRKKYWFAYGGSVKLMALALKDIYIDDGFITDVKCKIKEVNGESL